MVGRIYGVCATLTLSYDSNCTVSNYTSIVPKVYFYYGSAFISFMRGSSGTFNNININVTGYNGAS